MLGRPLERQAKPVALVHRQEPVLKNERLVQTIDAFDIAEPRITVVVEWEHGEWVVRRGV